MAAFIPKRRGRGEGITRAMASLADIRTPADLIAFLLCAFLTVFVCWAITHPWQFRDLVLGVFGV